MLGVPKVRRYVSVSGPMKHGEIVPFNHDFSTLVRAVNERVFNVKGGEGLVPPPRPVPGVFAQRLSAVDTLLTESHPSTAPVSHAAFVASYAGSRKKAFYQKVLDGMNAKQVHAREAATVSAFVKFEKTDWNAKSDPVPRVISPRKPEFNIMLGRYLKHFEHQAFKWLSKLFGHQTVFKGINAEKSAKLMREKWEMFNHPVAVGLDASRFDQHVSAEALKWEHRQYLKCFYGKHKKQLANLLACQIDNRCFGYTPDGTVNYRINGTRMSGDMNTSLGNCILMCSMIKAYLMERGVNAQLANNGDDCVVVMEQKDLPRFMDDLSSWFLELGFNMTIEKPVTEFEQIEFCQTRPVFDGSNWIMCRNPHTAIDRDCVMMEPFNHNVLQRWMHAVGTGGLRLTGGIPVFQEFYRWMVEYGRDIPSQRLHKRTADSGNEFRLSMPWGLRHMTDGLKRVYTEITPQARASFWMAYDITPSEQIELEDYFRNLKYSSMPGLFTGRETPL